MPLRKQVWLAQYRYLRLGKCTLPTATIMNSSLPQGDPVSPLGLLLILGDAITDISASNVQQTTFLDDRVSTADAVALFSKADVNGFSGVPGWDCRKMITELSHLPRRATRGWLLSVPDFFHKKSAIRSVF